MFTCLCREKVSVAFKGVVVCCPTCGKSMDLVGVTRFVGVGGLVYGAWGNNGSDDDCW